MAKLCEGCSTSGEADGEIVGYIRLPYLQLETTGFAFNTEAGRSALYLDNVRGRNGWVGVLLDANGNPSRPMYMPNLFRNTGEGHIEEDDPRTYLDYFEDKISMCPGSCNGSCPAFEAHHIANQDLADEAIEWVRQIDESGNGPSRGPLSDIVIVGSKTAEPHSWQRRSP